MPAELPATETRRSMPVHALIFGGVAGVIGAAVRWGEFAFSFYGRLAEIILIFVPLIAIILGVQRWRDAVLGGAIRFSQAFGAALAIGLVYSLVQAAFGWLHAAVLAPDLVDTFAAWLRESGQQQGETAEKIAEAESNLRRNFTPAAYAKFVFAISLVTTFIVSLLSSLFVRRNVRP